MPTPIPYALVNGVRHDRSSCELKVIAQTPTVSQIMFFKELNHDRTRTRSLPRGNHPDPVGKTRGMNEYKMDITWYEAEYNWLVETFSSIGNGYGDVFFTVFLRIVEPWADPITIEALGCTLDTESAAVADSADALAIKTELNPIKILRNGVDDLAVPLVGPSQS